MNALFRMLLIAWLINLTGFVSAQQRDREPARCVGKLKGMGPGVLQVETDKGERMLVAIEARPENISFQGSATPAFLRSGMLVQFEASLDKKGEAQEEIGAIKVIAQRMGVQVGLKPGGGFTGGELFASKDDDGGKKKKKGRATDASPYQVTGKLQSIKDGKMYVAAGSTVRAELSTNCQVDFNISDISLAREGDSVEVADGWRFANQSNQLYARRLTITADKPLGVDEKKRRAPGKGDDKKTEGKLPAGIPESGDGKKGKAKGAEEVKKDKAEEAKKDKAEEAKKDK